MLGQLWACICLGGEFREFKSPRLALTSLRDLQQNGERPWAQTRPCLSGGRGNLHLSPIPSLGRGSPALWDPGCVSRAHTHRSCPILRAKLTPSNFPHELGAISPQVPDTGPTNTVGSKKALGPLPRDTGPRGSQFPKSHCLPPCSHPPTPPLTPGAPHPATGVGLPGPHSAS